MDDYTKFDFDGIAHIGIIFLDGDALEDILIDAYGPTDYNFLNFNKCKEVLIKMERLNSNYKFSAFLWQKRPDNPNIVVPVVAGRQLPLTGWLKIEMTQAMRRAYNGEWGVKDQRQGGCHSYYYPVKNSNAEIVGILEILSGGAEIVDI